MQEHEGVGDVVFFGYANDYLGYQLQEDDWWHGGYEASGAMWGPRQGEYMKGVQAEVFAQYAAGAELGFAPPDRVAPFDLSDLDPYEAEVAVGFGGVSQQPSSTYVGSGVVSFSIDGGDPWLGAPVAVLQRDSGGVFEDVVRSDGRPVDSDGNGFWLDLAPDPGYGEDEAAESRTFRWTFSFPLTRRDAGLGSPLSGSYRFVVDVPGGPDGSLSVETTAFEVLGSG